MHNSGINQIERGIDRFTGFKLFLLRHYDLIICIITVFLIWLSVYQLGIVLTNLGVMIEGKAWVARYQLVQLAAASVSFCVIFLGISQRLINIAGKLFSKLAENSFMRFIWIVTAFSILITLLYLFYHKYTYLNNGFYIRLLFAWILFWLFYSTLMAIKEFQAARLEQKVILSAILSAGVITLAINLCRINNNPLSATWSEGSVLFYASAFISRHIYGTQVGLPVINPGKSLLQSIPFLFSGFPISIHRLWDASLWISLPLLVGYSLVKRLKIVNSLQAVSLILFSLLFLNIGPVYYHLLVTALIILIGFHPQHFWKSVVFVAIAASWGGLTRINWYPVPGTLAAILYWVEVPSQKKNLKNLWKPAVWFTSGFTVSVASYQLYIRISGTPAAYFENPFSTLLLWERLFPNATNPLGILLEILLAALPSLIFIGIFYFHTCSFAWNRRAGVFTLMLAFFLGGFLVSVRIGGGNNLHNFDAYLLLLMIMIGYIFFNRIPADRPAANTIPPLGKPILTALILFMPLLKPISTAPTFPVAVPEAEFKLFLAQVEDDIKAGKSVLLLDEAHLIAFDFWEAPPALPEFNKVFLSEAAITGNHAYLDNYYTALTSQKFDYIVTEPLNPYYFGSDHPFDKETVAWINSVTDPTLCYYEIKHSYMELGLDYLTPRDTPCEDPNLLP